MHKCVRCGSVYEDNDGNILRGCNSCGSIFFLYTSGPTDSGATQLEAVKQELRSRDTTIEKELSREIDKRKAQETREPTQEEVDRGTKQIIEQAIEWNAGEGISKAGPGKESVARRVTKSKSKSAAKGSEIREGGRVIEVTPRRYDFGDMFGVETVRMPKNGVYEINIDALMKHRPVIVLEKGGIYIIHLPQVFDSKPKESGK